MTNIFQEWICNLFGCNKEVEECEKEMDEIIGQRDEIKHKFNECNQTLDSKARFLADCIISKIQLAEQLTNCQSQMKGLEDEKSFLEDRIDYLTKPHPFDLEYPRVKIIYRNKRYITNTYNEKVFLDYDIREFIYGDDYYMQYLHDEITALYRPNTEEQDVRAVMAYIAQNVVKYELDSYLHGGVEDFWQFPEETYRLGRGDCEDLSSLVASLLRTFVEPARVKEILGMYQHKYGHAWVEYHDGNEWKLLEPTRPFKYTSQLESVANLPDYKKYYAFNDRYTWVIDDSISFGVVLDSLMDAESRKAQYGIGQQVI